MGLRCPNTTCGTTNFSHIDPNSNIFNNKLLAPPPWGATLARMPHATFVSYRLGGTDGVAIEAAKWMEAFARLGWTVDTVCGTTGDGDIDAQHTVISGLELQAPTPPDPAALADALSHADVVVVENMLSLPMNLPAALAVAATLADRRALIHHHDMAWQRDAYRHIVPWPPTDPRWRHACINGLTRDELAARGVSATVIYNCFDPSEWNGSRGAGRAAVGVDDAARVVLQPTRAIGRKNVAAGIALAERAGAVFWIPGNVEDGFDAEFDQLMNAARCPIIRRRIPIADAYAACDLVAFPSTWEGFGNPAIESALAHRPLAIGHYPVATELRQFGFRWHDATDPDAAARVLAHPDNAETSHNASVALEYFSTDRLDRQLDELLGNWVR